MPTTVIDRLYEDSAALRELLSQQGELSLLASVEASFRKTLLLSAASYFEHTLREGLLDIFSERSGGDELTLSIIRQKAIERQYHTYFDWDKKNANKFFSLFGAPFLAHMKERIAADSRRGEAVIAFLELGSLRNRLVHLDFANFPLEKTAEEIFQQYRLALEFVDDVLRELRAYEPPGAEMELR